MLLLKGNIVKITGPGWIFFQTSSVHNSTQQRTNSYVKLVLVLAIVMMVLETVLALMIWLYISTAITNNRIAIRWNSLKRSWPNSIDPQLLSATIRTSESESTSTFRTSSSFPKNKLMLKAAGWPQFTVPKIRTLCRLPFQISESVRKLMKDMWKETSKIYISIWIKMQENFKQKIIKDSSRLLFIQMKTKQLTYLWRIEQELWTKLHKNNLFNSKWIDFQ